MIKTLFILILSGIFIGIYAEHITLPQKDGHVFSDLQDEYKLIGYFLNTNQKQYYKKLDTEDKWEFLFAFWKVQDLNPKTEDNEFQEEIIARIKYSNRHFSHFKKGWKTDMGKVHIKFGEPFEILELTTEHISILKPKDYQIWKYVISNYQTYLFIDLQQHGDFRLIFCDGDEKGGSKEYWENLLDATFDEESLHYWR